MTLKSNELFIVLTGGTPGSPSRTPPQGHDTSTISWFIILFGFFIFFSLLFILFYACVGSVGLLNLFLLENDQDEWEPSFLNWQADRWLPFEISHEKRHNQYDCCHFIGKNRNRWTQMKIKKVSFGGSHQKRRERQQRDVIEIHKSWLWRSP